MDLNDPTAFHHKPIPMDELIIVEPMNKDNFLPSEEEKVLIRRLQAWENEPPNPYYRMR